MLIFLYAEILPSDHLTVTLSLGDIAIMVAFLISAPSFLLTLMPISLFMDGIQSSDTAIHSVTGTFGMNQSIKLLIADIVAKEQSINNE